MSLTIQDHANAFLALLQAVPGMTTYDGAVPRAPTVPPERYALVYFSIENPDGVAAPDKTSLTFDAVAINARAYVHCVGGNAMSARAVSGLVRDAVLNVTPSVAGRSCFPIRWLEGQPPQRDESSGPLVMDLVDVYGWTSVPA